MNDMTLRKHHSTPYLIFPALEGTGMVQHGFSVRDGGVSTGPYASMNLSFTMGDRAENVLENYERMALALEVDRAQMTSVWQAHTNYVKVIDISDVGKGITRPKEPEEIDGMVTNLKGVTLVTLHADCLPLYFLDPVNRAIGLTHSGWRGTEKAIGIKTLEAMEKAFVDLLGEKRASDVLMPSHLGKSLLDLTQVNEMLLLDAGIRRECLFTADLCTFSRPDLFFSHRRDGNNRGSMAAFLSLK